MARLASQLNQYQTNNNGRLPNSSIPGGVTKCKSKDATYGEIGSVEDTAAEACKFIKNYMNAANAQAGDESEFVDPSGDPYELDIQPAPDGSTSLDNDDFGQRVVYLYTGGRCDGESVVQTANSRDYAILYKLEGSGIYCKDSQ